MSEEINMTEYLQETANQSPGATLRRARESGRLSKAEVAQQLRLTVDTIERLETDDYEKLPAVTFVRGYIRAYARLLKLPADEIVAEFERLGRVDQPGEFSTQQIYGERTTLNEKLLWIGISGLLGLVIMLIVWWQIHASNNKNLKTVLPVMAAEQPIKQPVNPTIQQPEMKQAAQTSSTSEAAANSANNSSSGNTNTSPSSQGLVSDILQTPTLRNPTPLSKVQQPEKSATTNETDASEGQNIEDVQPDIAAPF